MTIQEMNFIAIEAGRPAGDAKRLEAFSSQVARLAA